MKKKRSIKYAHYKSERFCDYYHLFWHTWGRWAPPVRQADCVAYCYWDLECASWQGDQFHTAPSADYYRSDTELLDESFATNWDSSFLYCLLSPTPTNEISSPIDSPLHTWAYTYDVGWSYHTCPCDCGTFYILEKKQKILVKIKILCVGDLLV